MYSNRIPIVYVISSLNTPNAGTEGHLLRLVRSLDRERYEPRLVVLQHSDWVDEFRDPAVPIEVLGFRSFWRPTDWSVIWRLARLMRHHRARIAELYFTDAHFVGTMAAWCAGVPVVLSCRRDLAHQYGLKERLLSRVGNCFVTRFIANSKQVVERIAQVERISCDRFVTILNGIDLQAFDAASGLEPCPEFAEATRGKQVVAILANLRPIKNHSGLLQAARIVVNQRDDVVFAMMGSGELLASLRDQAELLGIGNHVLWLGSVPDPASYLVRSHIGCLPSHSEGASNAILEYMAAGLPVVATQVGGADEAIEDGRTGLLVPPNDPSSLAHALIKLVRDEPLRQTMGWQGRNRMESLFTIDAQIAAYDELYSSLLAADGR